jgi:hypothetical protein
MDQSGHAIVTQSFLFYFGQSVVSPSKKLRDIRGFFLVRHCGQPVTICLFSSQPIDFLAQIISIFNIVMSDTCQFVTVNSLLGSYTSYFASSSYFAAAASPLSAATTGAAAY